MTLSVPQTTERTCSVCFIPENELSGPSVKLTVEKKDGPDCIDLICRECFTLYLMRNYGREYYCPTCRRKIEKVDGNPLDETIDKIARDILENLHGASTPEVETVFQDALRRGDTRIVGPLLQDPRLSELINGEFFVAQFLAAARRNYVPLCQTFMKDRRFEELSQLQLKKIFRFLIENNCIEIFSLALATPQFSQLDQEDYKNGLFACVRMGRLELLVKLVNFPHYRISDSTIESAILDAPFYGHIDILRFLFEHFNPPISKETYVWALKNASFNGHINVLDYLLRKKPMNLTEEELLEVVSDTGRSGQLSALVLFHEFDEKTASEKFINETLRKAAICGHNHILSYLLRKYGMIVTENGFNDAFENAALFERIDTLRLFLKERGNLISSTTMMKVSCLSGSPKVYRFLLPRIPACKTLSLALLPLSLIALSRLLGSSSEEL